MVDWATLGMSGILSPTDDKNVPGSLRQKIALAMLLQKRAYPKTFGEGLASIGDSLGDAFAVRGIYGDAAAAEKVGSQAYDDIVGGGGSTPPPPPTRSSYAPETPNAPIVPTTRAATPPLMPARPLQPDEIQSDEPGAPHRLPSPEAVQDWRNSVPRPNIPPMPQQPPLTPPSPVERLRPVRDITTNPEDYPPSRAVTPAQPTPFSDRFSGGPRAAMQPPPGTPVMAAGDEPSAEERDAGRNILAQGMIQQQQQQQRGQQPPVVPPPQPQPQQPPPIVSAPQPPPVRAVPPPPPPPPPQPPAEAGPGPGHILTLGPEKPPPPTMTPVMQRIQEKIRATPPAYRETVQQQLKPLYEQEQAKVSQAHELHKDYLTQRRALELKREDQIAAAAKSKQDYAVQQEALRKAQVPEVKQDVEIGLTYNANTGQWEAPKIAGAGPSTKPAFKGTEFQGKALVNYGRARLAHEDLIASDGKGEKALSSSPLQSTLSSLPGGVGRAARSGEFKEADTAADNFVQAFIRQQSGGAYTDPELEKEARSMLPKYGDTEEQLSNKREQRAQFLSGLHSIVGSSGQKIIEIDAADRARQRDERARTKTDKPAEVDPLEGREALLPDKSIVVRRGGKWVPK